MATDSTADDFTLPPADALVREQAAVDAALEEARQALNEIRAKASTVDVALSENATYSLHDVPGVGRYAIPRFSGWRPLLDIMHDKAANIDFSLKDYPHFDALLGEQFNSPYLLDPLDDKYESYRSLRDNIAAVRNFLMQSYYASPDPGMTPEKAKQALSEIGEFVGKGLYNNWQWHGVIDYHHWNEPFIDLDRARAKNGDGAQYIYERILAHNRHSNWTRPWAAITALFGGKAPPEWMLPDANATHFTSWEEHDISDLKGATAMSAELVAITSRIADLEIRQADLRAQAALNQTSNDLDALGNQLLFSAQNTNSVATLAPDEQRKAVEIAKDILRKLKINLGGANIVEGLKLKPSDDLATFGSIKGVAMVYERVLAWSRGVDASILQDPSVQAATRAIGQLGYLAKLEALNMARAAGNRVQASNLTEQLKRIPAGFSTGSDMTLGGLLEKLERGLDTLINRAPNISSHTGSVSHTRDNSQGYMGGTPIAGLAAQVQAGETVDRNAKAMVADQQIAQMQAEKLLQQVAANSRSQSAAQGQTAPAQPAPSRSATAGRTNLAQARTAQRSSTSVSATAPMPAGTSPAQLQQAQRNAANVAAQRHAHEMEEKYHHDQVLANQAAQRAAAAKAMQKIDKNLIKGIQAATSTAGITTAPITGGKKPQSYAASVKPATSQTAEELQKQQQLVQPPVPPTKGGRGF